MNTSLEKIGCFITVLDPYNGITIDKKDLPKTKEEFELNLDFLIDEVKNNGPPLQTSDTQSLLCIFRL